MRDTDLPEFAQLLDATCALMTRGTYTPNDISTDIFFHALADFDIATVRQGFSAHVRSSRFSPTPADIRDAIEKARGGDGRLGAEEAWALALTSRDEADTVVWTAEIAQAWNIARIVYDQGDEIGARVAFREAYNRLVAEARAARRPLAWIVAEGFDQSRRAAAVAEAAERGRHLILSEDQAAALRLPAAGPVALLPAPDGPDPYAEARAEALKQLQAIAARITSTPAPVSAAMADLPRIRALQASTDEAVKAYAGSRA